MGRGIPPIAACPEEKGRGASPTSQRHKHYRIAARRAALVLHGSVTKSVGVSQGAREDLHSEASSRQVFSHLALNVEVSGNQVLGIRHGGGNKRRWQRLAVGVAHIDVQSFLDIVVRQYAHGYAKCRTSLPGGSWFFRVVLVASIIAYGGMYL